MGNDIDLGKFDIQKFGESISKAAREHVKWELKKLEWIQAEKKKAESQREAA